MAASYHVSAVFLIAILVSACSDKIKIETEEYVPRFACTGDTVSAHVALNKKVDLIRITDHTGAPLGRWSNKKNVSLSVDNISQSRLPLDVFAKEGSAKINRSSNIELFDNEHWSENFSAISVDSEPQIGAGLFSDESTEVCICLATDKDGNCTQQSCTTTHLCYKTYPISFLVKAHYWQLGPFSSARLKVTGVKNLTENTIQVDGSVVAPQQEQTLAPTSPSMLTIRSVFTPPIVQHCGMLRKSATCPNEICLHGCDDQPDKADIQSMYCYEPPSPIIQIKAICELNE